MKTRQTEVKVVQVPALEALRMTVRTVESRTPARYGEAWWDASGSASGWWRGADSAETHPADRWKPVPPTPRRLANRRAVCQAAAWDLRV